MLFHIPASIACVCLLTTYGELLDTWSYMYQLPSLRFCLLTTYSESVVRSSCWFIQGFRLGAERLYNYLYMRCQKTTELRVRVQALKIAATFFEFYNV